MSLTAEQTRQLKGGVPASQGTHIPQRNPAYRPTAPVGPGGAQMAVPDMRNWSNSQIERYIRENYGYMAWVLEEPSLRNIFIQAVKEGRDNNWIQSRVQSSEWFRNTEPSRRDWQQFQSEDPAGAARMVADTALQIQMRANQLGVSVSGTRAQQMARDFVANGWVGSDGSPASPMFDRSIILEGNFNPAQLGGDIAATAAAVQALAHDYMVPVSRDVANEWAQKVLMGDATPDGVEAYFREQALSRFPQLSRYIEMGITPRQFFDPYVNEAARLLEVAPNSIDLLGDPAFSAIVDFSGEPMSFTELQRYVRSMDRWQDTRQANQTAAETAERIGQLFGATP